MLCTGLGESCELLPAYYCERASYLYWEGANPHQLQERSLHSERVKVWCAVREFGVLGPYFVEGEDDSVVTITSACCIEILENFLQPQLIELAADVEDI